MTPQLMHDLEQRSAKASEEIDRCLEIMPADALALMARDLATANRDTGMMMMNRWKEEVLTLVMRLSADRIQLFLTRKITEVQQ